MAFLQVVATSRYAIPSGPPYLHIPFYTPFEPSRRPYGAMVLPDDVTELDIVLAPAQWGARLQVKSDYDGVMTTICDLVLAANANSETGAYRNASAASAILAGTTPATGGSWSVTSAQSRLLRTCTLTPLMGATGLTITVTSPGGSVVQDYTMTFDREPSAVCRLSSLALAYRTSATSSSAFASLPAAPSRPDFAPATHEYYSALTGDATSLDVRATTMHGDRCAGVYDGVRCSRPTRISISAVEDSSHTLLSQPSNGVLYNDSVTASLSVPDGRTTVYISVESESQALGGSGTCVYNVSVSKNLLGATEYRVELGFTASNDITDFSATRVNAIRAALASTASVLPSRVNVLVGAGSVDVTGQIFSPSLNAANTVMVALTSISSSATAFSNFLTTNGVNGVTLLGSPGLARTSVSLISTVSIGLFAAAPTTLASAPSTEVLTIGTLTAGNGSSGAAGYTLTPTQGHLTQSVPNWATAVILSPIVANRATFAVDCPACANLPVGSSTARIDVTAEDQTNIAVVTITLTRLPSSDCSLASLRLLASTDHLLGTPVPAVPIITWQPPYHSDLSVNVANMQLNVRAEATPTHAASSMRYQFVTYRPTNDCDTSGCMTLPRGVPSSIHNLAIGTSYLQLTVVAQTGNPCTTRVTITRASSSDTSLGEIVANPIRVSNSREEIDRQRTMYAATNVSNPACPISGHTPEGHGRCTVLSLSNAEDRIFFRAATNHSTFCASAAHACSNNTSSRSSRRFR